MFNEEYHIQLALMAWIKANHPELIVTIAPNGMKLPIGSAVKLKRMGYLKGTPDILIFKPTEKYHGLFIELKTSSGKLSPEQNDLIKKLNNLNYRAVVCRSVCEAQVQIQTYLDDEEC